MLDKYIILGKKTKKIKEKIKNIISRGITYYEFYEKVYKIFREENVDFAFPLNISKDSIAAHDTAKINDNRILDGVLKIDFGLREDGFLTDTAFTIDFYNKYEDLVNTCNEILEKVEEILKYGIKVREIGKLVEEIALSKGFKPVYNLFGHKIDYYELHSNISIPNYDNKNNKILEEGIYAIEIFITNGKGYVKDYGIPKIFQLLDKKTRNPIAKKFYEEIYKDRKYLPFDLFYLYKKFGKNYEFVYKILKQNNLIYEYYPLKEISNGIVAQFENTYLIKKNEVIRLT